MKENTAVASAAYSFCFGVLASGADFLSVVD
jgi:hypothetical protein